jgi:ATP-dependent helicase IRC3
MPQLRDYQIEALNAIKHDWQEHSDVLGVLPTGAGKTILFLSLLTELLQQQGKRGLILSHRRKLVMQPVDKLRMFWPEWLYKTGVVMGDQNECSKTLISATFQTLQSPNRLKRILAYGPIDYLITDEAHRACAKSYLDIYQMLKEANPNLRHVGVTATPHRGDGDGLAKVFQHVSIRRNIAQLTPRYLVPHRVLEIKTRAKLKGIRTGHDGDYIKSRLAQVFETDNCMELIVNSWQQYTPNKKFIAFTVTVEGAYKLAEEFTKAGIPVAAIEANTSDPERDRLENAFARGEIMGLTNCAIYGEGFDEPTIEAVLLARPTKSDSLWIQMMGRGLRPSPGKTECTVLDFAPEATRNLKMLGDLLGMPLPSKSVAKPEDELDSVDDGDIVGGWTFDGIAKGLEGDPLELVARELNYLDITPYAWAKHDGYLVLPIKQGKTLVITPLKPSQDAQNLLLVTSEKGRPAHVDQLLDGAFADLTDYAQAYADEHGDPVFQAKDRSWRKRGVTEKQIELLRKFGFRNDTIFKMTASDASAVIGWRFTKQALRNARWLY